jgi:hypothetical protein
MSDVPMWTCGVDGLDGGAHVVRAEVLAWCEEREELRCVVNGVGKTGRRADRKGRRRYGDGGGKV